VADDGMRRIHPTREEDRYVEIGAPYVKVGGVWRKMGFRGGMRTANRLNWASRQANMSIVHAGHYVKLEIELKRGYVPEDGLVAFPVGLNGLKRSGANILSDGRPVMSLRAPTMYDAANELDTRAIDGKFVSLAGQPYYLMTLPDLTGMSRPVIDPTLALQPDAAAGKDDRLLGAGYANNNFGLWPVLNQSAEPALLEFDVSSIDSASVCSQASLYLYHAVTGSAMAITETIYSIAVGNAAWIEGTKFNTLAGAGEPCWNALAADGVGGVTTPWAGSAGMSTAGVDYEVPSIGSFGLNGRDAVGTEYICALNTSRVAGWFGTVNSNYGMRLVATSWHGNFASSDNATASYRPKLIIEYALPGGGNIFQSAILHSSLYGKTLVR